MSLVSSCVNQNPKYSVFICPNKYFSILNLSTFTSVYLASFVISVNDISSLLLLRSKSCLCTHVWIQIHEINHSSSDVKCLGNCWLPLVDIWNYISPGGNYRTYITSVFAKLDMIVSHFWIKLRSILKTFQSQ